MDPEGRQLISAEDQGKLLRFLGIDDPHQWRQSWISQLINLELEAWHPNSSADWLWSLGIPLLSLAREYQGRKTLVGLSALPGCG